jgi:hypothetical protein
MTYQPGGPDEARHRTRERQLMIATIILAVLGVGFLVARGLGWV